MRPDPGLSEPRMRPQALLLTFFGAHVLGRDDAVYSGSLIDVAARAGVGEHATRSTLSRMVARGLLVPHRLGRRTYYTVSDEATTILTEASHRVWDEGVVNGDWDGSWTLFGFSLPESRRGDRHLLRSRLAWAGFGMLQHGLWISPNVVDPDELFADLGLIDDVKAFSSRPLASTDVDAMIAAAWDLERLAAEYRRFLSRWDVPEPQSSAPDDLARQLLLLSEWLLLVREDPRLPVQHLPTDWPGHRAQEVARTLRDTYEHPAEEIVDSVVERAERPSAH